jgi:ribosomal protein L29
MNEIRERSDEELGRLAHQLEGDLFKFRVQRHTSQLANPMLLRAARRTLARVRTVISARGLGLEQAGAQPPAGSPPATAAAVPAPRKAAPPAPAPAATAEAKAPAKPARPGRVPTRSKQAAKKAAKPAKAARTAAPKAKKSAPGRSTRGGK